jgi:hypothetical protein
LSLLAILVAWPIVDAFADLLEEVARPGDPASHLKKERIAATRLLTWIIRG